MLNSAMLRHGFILVFLMFLITNGSSQRLLAPQKIRVPIRSPYSATITWKQPPGIRYRSFNVLVRPPSATVEEPTDSSAQRRQIGNLVPGRRYTVSVIGVTGDGRHSPPNTYELWSEPLPPANLTLKSLTQIQFFFEINNNFGTYSVDTVGVEVNWEPSESTSSLAGYKVQINPKSGTEASPRPLLGAQPDLTNRIFIGLKPGEAYTFTVRSQTGPPYSLVYSKPISQGIRIPPAPPYSVEVIDLGTTTATIQTLGPIVGIHDDLFLVWSPPHGRISPPRPDPYRETHDIYTFSGLIPGTRYVLNVYSVSGGVRSENPFRIVFVTTPVAPNPVTVKDFTSTTITLSWRQPVSMVGKENVVYIIDIQDVDDSEAEVRTIRLPSIPDESTISVVIDDLIPGATYRFNVSTEVNDARSESATIVEHPTVPPRPRLKSLKGTTEGILFRIAQPETGRCPSLKVFYSPPLPGENKVEPRFHKVETNILIPGLPRDERYTIYVRCVSGVIEGPALLISSRAIFDQQSGGFNDDPDILPRRALPCLKTGRNVNVSARTLDPRLPPDACCGTRPFRKLSQVCCSAVVHKLMEGNLCCGTRYYSTSERLCCGNSTLADSQEDCPP